MINLLPKKDKERLLIGKNKRMTIILCFLVLFFLICFMIALFVIKIYLNGQLASSEIFLEESEKQFLQSETQEFQDKIRLANQSFNKLNSFYRKKMYYSEILEKVSAIFPESFYLTNLSIVFNVKDKNIKSSLSGFAPTRDDLLLFKENLEKESSFENIFFPISNWASKKDINFHITFDIPI